MRSSFFRTEGFRLSLIYTTAFALSALAMVVMAVVITDQSLRGQVLQSAGSDIAAIRKGYVGSEGFDEAREIVEQLMGAPAGSDFFLLQQNGKAVAGNLPAMPPRDGTLSLQRNGKDILGVGAHLSPDTYVFSGSDLSRIHDARGRLVQDMLWMLGAALAMAILGGALVSRSFLRRTDAMASACHAIMDGDMRARIPVRGSRDELDRLAGAINAMLDRIAALMENVRQVTNDIAHDLRTPVTHLRQGLEQASGEPPAHHAQALAAAITRTDEILALFAALLRIAQVEGGARRAGFAQIELSALLSHLREMFGPVADEAGRSLDVSIHGDGIIRGDRELLVQLFSNLIENAILHTPAGTQITLTLAPVSEGVAVTVADNGPGVPAEEHDRLFQRLYRREASRAQPGYGLGLAMVAAIAELHGATARIESVPGRGFAVRILFASAS